MKKEALYSRNPSTRKSIQYYITGGKSTSDLDSSLYASLFVEDLHIGIMPIGGRSNNSNFAVKIDPPSKRIEEIITFGLPSAQRNDQNLTEAICDFIEEAVQTLAYFGKAYYEIIYFYANENRDEIEGFQIDWIPSDNIRSVFGFYWQFIPKKVLKHDGKNQKRFIYLPKQDLLALSIPSSLGGVKKHRRLLSDLIWLSRSIFPEFVMRDMEKHRRTKGYDSVLYRQAHDRFIASETKHLGWIASGTFRERTLEFYQIYRHLKFQKTKAILREYVLNKLNDCLIVIGKKMGFGAQIKLEGIPSSQDFDNYIKQLMEGSLQFSKAVELTKI